MRLTYEKNSKGEKSCGVRKCDTCGKEQFMKKPRRWDICASCDMKNRYDAGKTIPPKQIKKTSYINYCENCNRAYEVYSTVLQKGKTRQRFCGAKCMVEGIKTEACKSCGIPTKPGKYSLCEKCNVKRWHREEGRAHIKYRYDNDLNYKLALVVRGRVKSSLRTQLNRRKKNTGSLAILRSG
jgi:hypothetical protein